MSDDISVQVTNQLSVPLTVYTTVTPPPTAPPSTDPDDYIPTYTSIGTVPANGTATLDTGALLSRLVIARQEDDFPVKLFVPDIMGPQTQPVTVQASDQAGTQTALKFYQDYVAQPYSPVALQFNEIVLDSANVATLDSQVSALLGANGYAGADFYGFSMVSYWATNSAYAWPGTYYCYEPSPLSGVGFIMPQDVVGTVALQNGAASFTAQDGGTSYPSLAYAGGQLTSPGASATSGIVVTGTYRTMTWEGRPSDSGMFWVGTRDGKQIILQPYQNPTLPWWIAAYNLAFTAFLGVQIVMMVDMAAHVLKGVAGGVQWLSKNASSLYDSIRTKTENVSENADPDASAGGDVDPINVDVDVDVDVDIDVDVVTDTDNVTDTDVDVDVDIDIDVDDDVFAIIDVDVDVDVDIDTDVVTDTDNVTDTDVDVDVDVDVDTDVNVPPGGVRNLLNKVGAWIVTKALPALVENAVIMGAMMGAQKLLSVWRSSDEQDLANMSPQESTGLGLLLNYMLNPNNSESVRWTTFADYIQQQTPDVTSQQMLLATIIMYKNDTADSEAAAWKWPEDTEDALVGQMAAFSAPAQQYQAYLLLANYSFQNQPLPVKVGAAVATKYLSKIG